MQFHQIKSKTKFRRARRVGRGGKRGTYSGRGIKGLGARAGGKFRPAEREILKKIPKKRGYKFSSLRNEKEKPFVVNFDAIAKKFSEGQTVSPETLLKSRLLRKKKGKIPAVKILGKGELGKKLVFKEVSFSKSAAKKLGGNV